MILFLTCRWIQHFNWRGRRITLSAVKSSAFLSPAPMLKDAPIVIFDEATANVDPENEDRLQAAIEELTKDKTIIMIAHRLKTVRNADQILVVSGGHIVQQANMMI